MLMDIDPLPMSGSLVMTMAMISPSWREVSLAEQLCHSPRLVPPRGGGVSSRKLSYDFFQGKRLHIAEDGHGRPARGPRGRGRAQGVGRAPKPHGQGVPPLRNFLRSVFFIYSENDFCKVSGLLELRRIGLQYLLLFQPRILAGKGANIRNLFCTAPKVLKLHETSFWNI